MYLSYHVQLRVMEHKYSQLLISQTLISEITFLYQGILFGHISYFNLYFHSFNLKLLMFRSKLRYQWFGMIFVVVALLFYVHGKHLRSCRDGQLT